MHCTQLIQSSNKSFNVLNIEIAQLILEANSFVSMAHPFADGDAIGSQLALHHFCQSLGKKSVFLNFDPLPDTLKWLPGLNEMRDTLSSDEKFDLLFMMETTEKNRMGDRLKYTANAKKIIHLDHHPGVSGLGDLNYIDETASSTCEILYRILSATDKPLPRATLEAVYVGIITDTGNFRFSNSTPSSHRIAAEIIEAGIDPSEIFRKVYECNPMSRIVIHGLVMSRAVVLPDYPISYSWLTLEDFEKYHASAIDADGAVNPLCTIAGIEVAAIFREQSDGETKISLRSNGKVNVQEICRKFGGGGHRQAAGAQVNFPLQKAVEKTLEVLREECRRLGF